MTLNRRAFLHSSLLTALAGCASQGPYRTNVDRCQATAAALVDCGSNSHIVVKQSSGQSLEYSVGVVEFREFC
jgi:nitrous oxide reductase